MKGEVFGHNVLGRTWGGEGEKKKIADKVVMEKTTQHG